MRFADGPVAAESTGAGCIDVTPAPPPSSCLSTILQVRCVKFARDVVGSPNMTVGVRMMKTIRGWSLLFGAAMALSLVACGSVNLAPPVGDTPLVSQIRARVGIVFTSAASTNVVSNPLMRMEMGKACTADFMRTFSAMFSQPVALPDWPPWRHARPDVDGVMEVEDCRADLKLGDDTSRNPDVAVVTYRVCLYEPDGKPIKCWSVSESQRYARGVFECMDMGQCMAELMNATKRQAMARFLTEAGNDPDLRAWQQRVERKDAVR